MTEYESYELALSFIEFGHNLGESALSQVQFWAAVSYALLAITFLAPEKLTIGATALLITLYVAFSTNTFTNIGFDIDTSVATRVDAQAILEEKGLSLEVLQEKQRSFTDEGLSSARRLTTLYIPGLILGTIGYILFICRREYVTKKKSDAP
jgi:hypothetical protein